jgi:hypothetical protein
MIIFPPVVLFIEVSVGHRIKKTCTEFFSDREKKYGFHP